MSTEKKKVKVSFNGKNKMMKIELTETLANVRKILGNDILDYVFLDGDDEIFLDQEEDFTIEDIIKDGILFMGPKDKEESKSKEIPKQITKQTPINGSKYLYDIGKLKIYLYPSKKFTPLEEKRAFSLMVVGQVGCGKTTLLNRLVNYLTGVQYEDDFRYVINHENLQNYNLLQSHASEVTIYNIASHNGNPPIKIIDTPGFGDIHGIQQDKILTTKIEDKFKTEIKAINAICFVVQSANARLTVNQKYIFQSIMDMFGKDVAANFVAMITFCDGQIPPIIEALKEEGSIFDKIIPQIKEPWYLQFNNSCIFSSSSENKFKRMFWELGMDSFRQFIDKLVTLPERSLVYLNDYLPELSDQKNDDT